MRRISVLIAAITLLAAACGGSSGTGSPFGDKALEKAAEQAGANVDVNSDGGLTINTDDGSLTIGGTDANGNSVDFSATGANGEVVVGKSYDSVPPDFPLPVPENVDIAYSSSTEVAGDTAWTLTFDFDPSRVDEIAALYESAATDQGFAVDGSSRDADSYMMIASRDTLNIIVGMTNYGDYWEADVEWASYGG